jgi:neurotransmitter:Na+ symporter, NSS family
MTTSNTRWSSGFAFYLGAAGAAVGLGSIWRFPYLAGTGGGSAFIIVFVLACVLIATPLLVAEFAMGRRSRRSPPNAAAGVEPGLSTNWNAIGILGTLAAFLVYSYYTVIAAWVFAYAWKCAAGVLTDAGPEGVGAIWTGFLSNPFEVGAWHIAFLVLVAVISARGLQRGIEVTDKVRAVGLLVLLFVLVGYSLATGDVKQGLTFAFKPDFSAINAQVVLAAIGQAFYATGVGEAMMIAYGAYVVRGTSLVRTSMIVSGSILFVSLLATLMIFPLVFGYGMNPAEGSQLVFEVLPRAFAEMPAGQVIGTLFFLLLVLAALMPSVALLEPAVAWLVDRAGVSRSAAVWWMTAAAWALGLGSVVSLKFFESVDYVASNIMLPVGALLTSILIGWRVSRALVADELMETTPFARTACIWLLRYLCPLAIVAVFVAAFLG